MKDKNIKRFFNDDSPEALKRWKELMDESQECRKDREIIEKIISSDLTGRSDEFWMSFYSELNLNVKSKIYSTGYSWKTTLKDWGRPLAVSVVTAAAFILVFLAGYHYRNLQEPQITFEKPEEIEFYLKEHFLSEDFNVLSEEPITSVYISTNSKEKKKK